MFCKGLTVYDVSLSGVTIEGVTWAARNVNKPGTFTEKVSDSGMFYQWNNITAYPDWYWLYTFASGTVWSTANDPCPSGWRIPTLSEAQTMLSKIVNSQLIGYYTFPDRRAIVDGHECQVVEFENNQFLVFNSHHVGMYYPNSYYWTSTQNGSDNAYAYKPETGVEGPTRYHMSKIRCVKK